MPLLVVAAIKNAQNTKWGIALTPSLFIVGFSVLAPLALAELFKPLIFNMIRDMAGLTMFLILSLIYLLLSIANLISLRLEKQQTLNLR